MKGWRAIVIAVFGAVFLLAGLSVIYVTRSENDAEAWGFALAWGFIAVGGFVLVYGIYSYTAGVRYAFEVCGQIARWERADTRREIGRLDLSMIKEFIYVKPDGEASAEILAVDMNGARTRLPIEFLDIVDLPRLLSYLRVEFSTVKITEQ